VAIARAMANDPLIILADEPTGNLDSKSGGEILDTLARLNTKEAKTLIVVTHDQHVANQAQRIIRFKDGRIQSDGDAGGEPA
jgi:putative ABC transport system ATP-binding protein